MSSVTWVLESDVFRECHGPLRAAIQAAGCRIVNWSDDWSSDGKFPILDRGPVVFHGSLGNAAAVSEELGWRPGAFCKTAAFYCSAWYEVARPWLLHPNWRILPADAFVAHAREVASDLGCGEKVFVRPDSPLKPFSGRVLPVEGITLDALDHGFYYDDDALPVVVAPVCSVEREWRFVVVETQVVAGSAYDPATRSALPDAPASEAWRFAQTIASALPQPEEVYVLDICQSDARLRLLELNPFSGADLYACSAESVVYGITDVAERTWERR